MLDSAKCLIYQRKAGFTIRYYYYVSSTINYNQGFKRLGAGDF